MEPGVHLVRRAMPITSYSRPEVFGAGWHSTRVEPTPVIREFLDRLQSLLDAKDRPRVANARVEVTAHDNEARVVVPAADPDGYGIELEVDPTFVFVSWPPERQRIRGYDDALRAVEALLDGRVELVVSDHFVYRTRVSYIDGRPYLVTRMPALTFRLGSERRRFF
jgi:hypothetical protein